MQVTLECRRLADKNTRLIYENEALLKQLAAPDNNNIALGSRSSDSFKGGSGNIAAQKGLSSKFSKMFRRRYVQNLAVKTLNSYGFLPLILYKL